MFKLYNKNKSNQPQGATSLLVVVGISLVFIVIISGLTALSIRESRQALSTDLSNRALAAAESYVKQTAQDISDNPSLLTDNGCSDEKSAPIIISNDSDNSTEVTCRTISSSGTAVEREVEKDKTSILYGIKGDYTMTFKWGKQVICDPAQGGRSSGPLGDSEDLDLIQDKDYRAGCPIPSPPAVLELMFFSWEDNSLRAIDGITPKTVLIMPKETVQEVNTGKPSDFNAIATDNSCTDAVGADGYHCSFKLDLSTYLGTISNSNVSLMVRPRYSDTNYLAEFSKGGILQPVQSNTALIDVTARVGDYYRRATGQVNLGGIQNTNVISDVMYSLESICKRMTVGESFNQIRSNTCN